MATVSLKVHANTRELWVEAANGEGINLSEWLRRAAQQRLGSAGAGAKPPTGAGVYVPVPVEPSHVGVEEVTEATVPVGLRASTPSTAGAGETDVGASPTGEAEADSSDPSAPSAPSAPAPAIEAATEDALARARELLGAPRKEFRPDFKQAKAAKKKR